MTSFTAIPSDYDCDRAVQCIIANKPLPGEISIESFVRFCIRRGRTAHLSILYAHEISVPIDYISLTCAVHNPRVLKYILFHAPIRVNDLAQLYADFYEDAPPESIDILERELFESVSLNKLHL